MVRKLGILEKEIPHKIVARHATSSEWGGLDPKIISLILKGKDEGVSLQMIFSFPKPYPKLNGFHDPQFTAVRWGSHVESLLEYLNFTPDIDFLRRLYPEEAINKRIRPQKYFLIMGVFIMVYFILLSVFH